VFWLIPIAIVLAIILGFGLDVWLKG